MRQVQLDQPDQWEPLDQLEPSDHQGFQVPRGQLGRMELQVLRGREVYQGPKDLKEMLGVRVQSVSPVTSGLWVVLGALEVLVRRDQ